MARRKHTLEFKRSAVQLVNQQGYSVPQAARSLGVDVTSIRGWLKKFSDEEGMASCVLCNCPISLPGGGRHDDIYFSSFQGGKRHQ